MGLTETRFLILSMAFGTLVLGIVLPLGLAFLIVYRWSSQPTLEGGPAEEEGYSDEQPEEPLTGRRAYDLVADTVAGLNIRGSDNAFQALSVALSSLMLALMAAIIFRVNPSFQVPWYGGAIMGAFAGLILGTFGSGIFLMAYRAVRHMSGHHD